MVDAIPRFFRNQILSGLTERELAFLTPEIEPIELPAKMVLEVPGEPIEYVYFLASGLASVIAMDTHGKRIDAGLVGRDGMTALAVILGDDRSPHETVVQSRGEGHRLAIEVLREAMQANPVIRDRFLLYTQAFLIQVEQTALANGQHTLEARLARWLLMCQDRTDADTLRLTHEFLSVMLGVRRAGVTIALQIIEGRGVIKATRGCIRILDRGGLEIIADGSYGVAEAEYARLMA